MSLFPHFLVEIFNINHEFFQDFSILLHSCSLGLSNRNKGADRNEEKMLTSLNSFVIKLADHVLHLSNSSKIETILELISK